MLKSKIKRKVEENKFLEESEYLELVEDAGRNMETVSRLIFYLIFYNGLRYLETVELICDDLYCQNLLPGVNKTISKRIRIYQE